MPGAPPASISSQYCERRWQKAPTSSLRSAFKATGSNSDFPPLPENVQTPGADPEVGLGPELRPTAPNGLHCQAVAQRFEAVAGDGDFGSFLVAKAQNGAAGKPWLEFLHECRVYQRRTMDPNPVPGVQLFFELRDGVVH